MVGLAEREGAAEKAKKAAPDAELIGLAQSELLDSDWLTLCACN